MSELRIPDIDHDDTAFVVKEVTVLSGFIAAVGKLWSMYRKERPKKTNLRETVEAMQADISALKESQAEIKEDHVNLINSITQILTELSGLRSDQRQTRVALDNTQQTMSQILTMKQQEQRERERDKHG